MASWISTKTSFVFAVVFVGFDQSEVSFNESIGDVMVTVRRNQAIASDLQLRVVSDEGIFCLVVYS